MRLSLIPLVFACASCAAPSENFRTQPVTRVEIDGSVFDVRVQDDLAEAIRTNPEYAPRLGPIGARATAAMELVSGCTVKEIRGDQAQILGRLNCGRPPGYETLLVPRSSYSCHTVHTLDGPGDDLDNLALNCDPI